MRIAFIVTFFPRLSQTFVLNQITGLIDRGHHVDIFANQVENENVLHEDIRKYEQYWRVFYPIKVPSNKFLRLRQAGCYFRKNYHQGFRTLINSLNVVKYGRHAASLRLAFKVMPFADKPPYDVIHCQFGPNGNIAVFLRSIGALRGKIITTFHGYDIRQGLEDGGRIYSELFKKGDLFISISPYNYQNMIDFGLAEEKVVYHPVGIDLKKFSYCRNGRQVKNKIPVRLITVARLVPEKGLGYAIHAIHSLLQNYPSLNLEYNIIGSGPLIEELSELIEVLHLDKVVHLLGAKDQTQIIHALDNSDIFILPSVAEALPVVLMEAQSTGLPVIATKVGSVDKIILNEKSGFLVPPRNVDILADKIYYLCNHPEMWHVMGKAGRHNVENNFDIHKLNDRLENIYQALIQQ